MPDGQAGHCALIVNRTEITQSATLLVVLSACFALLLSCGGVPPLHGGQVLDEARSAGRTAQSFPAAGEDYFHDMDGGIPLSPDEIKGRNTWLVDQAKVIPPRVTAELKARVRRYRLQKIDHASARRR